MYKNYLRLFFGIAAAIVFTVTAARAEDPQVRRVSGEIGWVDVQLGRLELNNETSNGTKTIAYRINDNETRVTDSKDLQYLNVGDLRAGQFVTIEVPQEKVDQVATKIILEPSPASEFQQAFGELQAIDTRAGTLSLEERVRVGQEERTRVSYFTFDPLSVVAMRSPSKQPVELALNPGDVVKIDYVALNGKQQARYITLYSPVVTSSTTTTTTTVTTQQE